MSNKKIACKLFAQARDLMECETIEIDCPIPITLEDFCEQLAMAHPELRGLLGFSRIAVNLEFVDLQFIIQGDEEFALIPPVGGG